MLLSMWNLPGPETEPVSPALTSGFLSTAPPGKSCSSLKKSIKQSTNLGTFLAVQWLRLCASMGLIPDEDIKIPHSSQHGQKKKSVLGSVSHWRYTVRIGKPCRKPTCVHSPAGPLSLLLQVLTANCLISQKHSIARRNPAGSAAQEREDSPTQC